MQVVGPAGLGADAGELEPAERLAIDQGTRDPAIDVQVADPELAARPARYSPGFANKARRSSAYGVPLAIRKASSRSRAFSTARTGPKTSSWASRAVGRTPATIMGPTKYPWSASGPDLAMEDDPALGRGDLLVFDDPPARVGVDHRTDERLGIIGGADLDGPGGLDQAGQECVVNSLEHDHTRARRTFLPRVSEGALDDADHGLVKVGVVVDHDRVLAAHLGDDALHVVLARLDVGRLAVDQQAHVARAGERHQIDAGVIDQGLAGLVAQPGQIVQHAGGRPASCSTRARCQAITGDCSAGLRTTVLPATSAATVMPVGIANGKFQGGMTTATPRGSGSV